MQLKRRGKGLVAVPATKVPPLTADKVRDTLERVRRRAPGSATVSHPGAPAAPRVRDRSHYGTFGLAEVRPWLPTDVFVSGRAS